MEKNAVRYTWVMATLLALAVAIVIVYVQGWSAAEKLAMGISSSMAVIVFFGFGWFVRKKVDERGKGIPASDERTAAMEGIIFRYSFIASFWALLIIAWFNILSRYLGRDQLPGDISIVMALSSMAIVWLFFNYYVNKRFESLIIRENS